MQLLELGYNVMYNDVDMVWLQDPFQYLEGSHDAYFTDDRTRVCAFLFTHIFFLFTHLLDILEFIYLFIKF